MGVGRSLPKDDVTSYVYGEEINNFTEVWGLLVLLHSSSMVLRHFLLAIWPCSPYRTSNGSFVFFVIPALLCE